MKHLFFLLFFFFVVLISYSQVPDAFNYQAIVRNTAGEIVANQNVSFRISILQNSESGSVVYVETHSATTNTFGLANLKIGDGKVVSGTFSPTGWGSALHFIKIEIDPEGGTAFSHIGTSQLLSVPYAFHAQTVEVDQVDDADADATNELQTISLSGTQLTLSDGGGTVTLPSSGGGDNWGTQTVVSDATLSGNGTTATPLKIAQQSATNGQVLKWNESIWAPANDALGGLNLPYNETVSSVDPAFFVTNSGTGDGIMGKTTGLTGIGVKGWANAKTGNSGGVYGQSDSETGFGVAGSAIAITGKNCGVNGTSLSFEGYGVKGITYSSIGVNYGVYGESASSTGIGVYGKSQKYGVSGLSTGASGAGVSGIGVNIGVSGSATGTSGQVYALIGETQSPVGYGVFGGNYSNTGTTYGVYGKVNSDDGFSGYFEGGKFYTNSKIGIDTKSPNGNLHINSSTVFTSLLITNSASGTNSTDGILFGLQYQDNSPNKYAYLVNQENCPFYLGSNNIKHLTISADGKIGIGNTSPSAGLHLKGNGFPGSFMFLEASSGQDAGLRLYEGGIAKWHIFNNAATGGLQIYNSAGTTAIFVKQSNAFVGIGTTAPTQALHVVGNAYKTEGGTSWATSSDIRLKNITGKYLKGLNEIAALQPVKYVYKKDNPRQLNSSIEQVGFVAQDVQKIFPEAVNEGEDGYLDFNIHPINIALVNAIKELKTENEQLSSKVKSLESRLEQLETLFNASASK